VPPGFSFEFAVCRQQATVGKARQWPFFGGKPLCAACIQARVALAGSERDPLVRTLELADLAVLFLN